jgi:hypothetical protein
VRQYFHWELAYPEVYFARQGHSLDDPGFSAIIGNPPYVRVELLDNQDKDFLKCRYSTLVDRCDIYSGFVEQGLRLLSSAGRLSMIVSGQFMTADYGVALKDLLWSSRTLHSILDLEPLQVFEGSTTYPIIVTCSKAPNTTLSAGSALMFCSSTPEAAENEMVFAKVTHAIRSIALADLHTSPWIWVKSLGFSIHPDMSEISPTKVGDICNISSSLKTGKDGILTAKVVGQTKSGWIVDWIEQRMEVSKALWRPILRAEQVQNWVVARPEEVVFFPYRVKRDRFELIDESEFKATCRTTYDALAVYREELMDRRDSRKTWEELGRPWYALHRIGKPADYEGIVLVSTGEFDINRFASCSLGYVWPCARVIGISQATVDVFALQLFLNSPEVWAWMRAKFPPKRGGYRGMSVGDLSEVPCPGRESRIWDELRRISNATDFSSVNEQSEAKLRSRVSQVVSASW